MARRSGRSTSWPDWWDWELEMTPHLEQRMEERAFTEIDVREMLEAATGFRPDVVGYDGFARIWEARLLN